MQCTMHKATGPCTAARVACALCCTCHAQLASCAAAKGKHNQYIMVCRHSVARAVKRHQVQDAQRAPGCKRATITPLTVRSPHTAACMLQPAIGGANN